MFRYTDEILPRCKERTPYRQDGIWSSHPDSFRIVLPSCDTVVPEMVSYISQMMWDERSRIVIL